MNINDFDFVVQMLFGTMFVIGAAILIVFVASIVASIMPQKEVSKHIIVRKTNGYVLGYLKSWDWKTNTFSVTLSEEEALKFYDEFDPCREYTLDGMIMHLNSIYKNQLFLPYTFVRSEGIHK